MRGSEQEMEVEQRTLVERPGRTVATRQEIRGRRDSG
jgi:hypothetical protein